MRITKDLPSLANVQAGGVATLNCPLGRTYDKIVLQYSGVTLAQMKKITVLVNGKPIQEYKDGDELQAINKYYGRPTTAGYLTLYFVRDEYKTNNDNRVTGLGTLDIQTLQISIDIDAAAAAPVISASAQLSDPRNMGAVTKVKSFSFNAAGSGEFEIDNIPKGPRILAMHFFKADVNAIEIELDSRKATEGTKALMEVYQKQGGRTPQTASATHVDYCLEGDILQALSTTTGKDGNLSLVQDFRVRATLGTSGALRVVVEYLDGYHGI